MPYQEKWVDPKLFMRFGNTRIYHLYKDDNTNNGPCTYYFTSDKHSEYLDIGMQNEDNFTFDVRDFSGGERLKAECPVFMTDSLNGGQSNPLWTNASPKRRKQIEKEWDIWFKTKEKQVIKEIIIEAIKSGRITSPKVKKNKKVFSN